MYQGHTPDPAGRKQSRVFTDIDASLPRRWLAGIWILHAAWCLEIDIETAKRYLTIRDRGACSGYTETHDRGPGRRWTCHFGGPFNEVCLERIVIVRLVGSDHTCGSRDEYRCLRGTCMGERLICRATGTSCQQEQNHSVP